MKVVINKDRMREAVRKVASSADKRGNIPILSNILFEADAQALRLTATNLEVGAVTSIECDVVVPGRVTVNAGRISKLLSSVVAQELEIEAQDGKLLVRSAGSRFSLATLPPEEFPEVELPPGFDVALPAEELDRAIRKVSYAVSKDEARYILTGVLFRSFGDRVHVVATDGHRLAVYEMDVKAREFSAIVPKRSLAELKKLLREGGEVEFAELENRLYFRVGGTTVWTSLIEGEYPDYLSVIPKDNPVEFTADRSEFLTALKEVSIIFDREEVKAVILKLSGGKLTLTTRKLEIESAPEEAEVTLPVEYRGEDFEIGFNINHLIESVASFDGDTLRVSMSEPVTPALVVSEEERELRNVIMPMKV